MHFSYYPEGYVKNWQDALFVGLSIAAWFIYQYFSVKSWRKRL